MPKILVIEDEKHISRLIEITLQREGHEIEKAFDGVEGLEKVESFKPDLIILDRMMPRMDGMEVMRNLQSNVTTADIPVIFLTAKAQDADVFDGWSSGASCYLTKPFNPNELKLFVNRVITTSTLDYEGYETEEIHEI